ncbi:methyltransferase, partial [Candidatus Entotheonella serta]
LVVPIPLPPQMRGILPLIDGERTVGALAEAVAPRGISENKFRKVWAEGFTTLERLNRVLLRPPA